LAVTGSTEKNIAVEQTGIGVTVIGACGKEQLRIGTSNPNDIVVAIGVPSVAEEVLPAEREGKIADTRDILELRELDFVHEIIPVGSTGIAHEIEALAEGAKLKFKIADQHEVDIEKSAGPATVILATLAKGDLKKLEQHIDKPVNVVAYFSA